MTDIHCHFSAGEAAVSELLIGRDAIGFHPWFADSVNEGELIAMKAHLVEEPRLAVGEIGLDRLKSRTVSEKMMSVFEAQLNMAVELDRPIILHGAKCWGQVVAKVKGALAANPRYDAPILFHGFSRSEGLLPEIFAMGGYVSVGPAILNDHAVNYRKLVAKLPLDRLLIETDRDTEEVGVTIQEVAAGVAKVLGKDLAEVERITDANAATFLR